MRVAFHVEGTTDQVVLCDFVEKIVGRAVEPHVYRKRAGGWAAAIATMVPAVWQAWQLGCVGAIVVVDADSTTPHELHAPDAPGDCRHCLLRSMLPRLPPRGDGSMTIVTAVPVQAIEAWLLAFGEHLLRQSVGPPQHLHRHEARRLLYGVVQPTPSEIREVCERLLPRVDSAASDRLAQSQVSFRDFRDQVRRFAQPSA